MHFHVWSAFIRLGGVIDSIDYIVEGKRRYSSDLPQGGMEIPCKLILKVRYKNSRSRVLKGRLKADSLGLIKYFINKQKTVARKHSRMIQISRNPRTYSSADDSQYTVYRDTKSKEAGKKILAQENPKILV